MKQAHTPVSVAALFALVLIAAALSGCVREPAPASPAAKATDEVPIAPVVASFDVGEGGIEGHVVDNSFLPIHDAQVRLMALGTTEDVIASVATLGDGTFAFSHVQPGEYRIVVTAERFANKTVLATVLEGEVATVSVVLEDVPGVDPYADLFIKNGMQGCAHSFFGADLNSLAPLSNTCAQLTATRALTLATNVSAGHKAAVFEAEWPESGVFGAWDVYTQTQEGGSQWHATGFQPAPVLQVLRAGEKSSDYATLTGITLDPYPESDTPFRFLGQMVYGGEHADTMRENAGPACTAIQGCGGVGFQLQWRFTLYATIFMNEAPANLDGYSALPDK